MKYLEQKFSGFSVIYLHNFEKCQKCGFSSISQSKPSSVFDWAMPEMVTKNHQLDYFKSLQHLSEKFPKDPQVMHPEPAVSTPLKTVKKKKPKPWCSKNRSSEQAKAPPKSKIQKKKTIMEKSSSTKKRSPKLDRKSNGSKIPGKGTLKRKQWYIEKLNEKDENYEDDLFENNDFGHFQRLLEDDSDSSGRYDGLKTPVFPFSISPRETTPSPLYRDCYSPTQLSNSRKEAAKYQYRKKKWRKSKSTEKKQEVPQVNLGKRIEEDVLSRLMQVSNILHLHRSRLREDGDNEEDDYFSDLNLPSIN